MVILKILQKILKNIKKYIDKEIWSSKIKNVAKTTKSLKEWGRHTEVKFWWTLDWNNRTLTKE